MLINNTTTKILHPELYYYRVIEHALEVVKKHYNLHQDTVVQCKQHLVNYFLIYKYFLFKLFSFHREIPTLHFTAHTELHL